MTDKQVLDFLEEMAEVESRIEPYHSGSNLVVNVKLQWRDTLLTRPLHDSRAQYTLRQIVQLTMRERKQSAKIAREILGDDK